jgi:hypothetical protein
LILAGARAYYAMARDGLFFKSSVLNDKHVPPGTWLFRAYGQRWSYRAPSSTTLPERSPAMEIFTATCSIT